MMKKKIELHVPGYTNVLYKRSGCSLPKTTKFGTQVTENYIFITETAVLYQTTLHRDMQYLTGRDTLYR